MLLDKQGTSSMTMLRIVAAVSASVFSAIFTAPAAYAQTPPVAAHNVVLVHGAWADGSSWANVIPLLQAAGLHVTAVQNPLSSLGDSVAATRRALAVQDGPTVLVGHSFGGSIISESGDDPKVTALVYVAARAPDAAEDFAALSAKYPTGAVRAGIQTSEGYTLLSEESFLKYFANGVDHKTAEVLFATQGATAAAALGERTTVAAWHSKPSFYAVAKQDHTIDPNLERFLAKRMNAKTIEVDSGHLPMVSHPQEIADLIIKAAGKHD